MGDVVAKNSQLIKSSGNLLLVQKARGHRGRKQNVTKTTQHCTASLLSWAKSWRHQRYHFTKEAFRYWREDNYLIIQSVWVRASSRLSKNSGEELLVILPTNLPTRHYWSVGTALKFHSITSTSHKLLHFSQVELNGTLLRIIKGELVSQRHTIIPAASSSSVHQIVITFNFFTASYIHITFIITSN